MSVAIYVTSLTPDGGSGPHSEPLKFKTASMQLTQIKAVDLSKNLSINSVDLGSSPTRSPDGKESFSGSGRAEGEHLGEGGQPHPPVNLPLASLGT